MAITLKPYKIDGDVLTGAWVVGNLPRESKARKAETVKLRQDATREGSTLIERGMLVLIADTENVAAVLKKRHPVTGRGRKPRPNALAQARAKAQAQG